MVNYQFLQLWHRDEERAKADMFSNIIQILMIISIIMIAENIERKTYKLERS